MARHASNEIKMLVAADYKGGMTVDAIAKKYGYCRRQIYVWLENVPKHGYNTPGTRKLGINKETAELMLKLIKCGIGKLAAHEVVTAETLESRLLNIADELTTF